MVLVLRVIENTLKMANFSSAASPPAIPISLLPRSIEASHVKKARKLKLKEIFFPPAFSGKVAQ